MRGDVPCVATSVRARRHRHDLAGVHAAVIGLQEPDFARRAPLDRFRDAAEEELRVRRIQGDYHRAAKTFDGTDRSARTFTGLLTALRGEGLDCGVIRRAHEDPDGRPTCMVSNYALLPYEAHVLRLCESAPAISTEQ
jgi:hypothetical protein